MATDINGTLLHHLSTGPGAACFLRTTCPDLLDAVDRMFRSRSDVRRLVEAENVASAILEKNDSDDLLRLRRIVARQELLRKIPYPDQKDHTAHTVYLYLLGVWLFDHLQDVRDNFALKHNISKGLVRWRSGCDSPKVEVKVDSVDERFLFHWMYASLLHDVGYAFYDLSPNTEQDRREINNLFSWEALRGLFESISAGAEAAIRAAHDKWEQNYPNPTIPMSLAPDRVLDHLAKAPWVTDLVERGKDLFDLLELNEQPLLRKYAYEVACKGYKPNDTACVDHAVASGLFLLRYSGFWYWLVDHVRLNNPKHYDELTRCFDNNKSNLEKDIIPACRAVAFHNVLSAVPAAKEIIPLLTLKDEPLLVLSVLADELQFWDRPPCGDKNLAEYEKYAESAFDGSELNLRCDGPRSMTKAALIVRSGFSSTADSKIQELRSKLNSRLPPGWDQLIELKAEALGP